MNAGAVVWGILSMSSAATAQGQLPNAEPEIATPGTTQPTPSAPAPAAAPAAPPVAEPPPPTPPRAEPPRPRVLWAEPAAESEEQGEVGATTAEAPIRPTGWQLEGAHFILAVERITSVLAWSNVSSADVGDSDFETELSGTDVAFLGAGRGRAISGVPRLAFDAVLEVGFSIGGSLSYVTSTNGKATYEGGGSAIDGSTSKLADQSISIVAPRLGGLLTPSPNVGVWLRGGITRIGTTETATVLGPSGDLQTMQLDATLWQLSLDPQLLLVPAPRVAITLAAILDIGMPGSVESQLEGESLINKTDFKSSGYGVSAGLAAIF